MVTPGSGELADSELAPWESLVIDAVGNVIEFWGFKRNQGRVWALLYVRGVPMSASDIQHALSLSKGAVSMISRELEQWGVIHRVRPPNSASWHFVAETDLMRMINRVLSDRESSVVARVKADLSEAEKQARQSDTIPEEIVDRLIRMRMLASTIERSLDSFLRTARFNANEVDGILDGEAATQPLSNGAARSS